MVNYYPYDENTDASLQSHMNEIVDSINTIQATGTGGGGDVEVAEVQDADTGRVTVNGELTRYLYRYIHYRITSDIGGQTLVDPTSYTGGQIYVSVNNSSSSVPSASAAYQTEAFAWDVGYSLEYRVSGRGDIFFQSASKAVGRPFVMVTSSVGTIDTTNVSLSSDDIPPAPTTVSSFAATSITHNDVYLTWEAAAADIGFTGLSFSVQQREQGAVEWNSVATVLYPQISFLVTGVATLAAIQEYRVVTVNSQGEMSSATGVEQVSPLSPLAPTNFLFTRDSADAGTFTWTIPSANMIHIKSFTLETRDQGSDVFEPYATIDGFERTFKVTSLQTENRTSSWRIKAVAYSDAESDYSGLQDITVPTVAPVLDFAVIPVERVGVLTTANISWTWPDADFWVYDRVTIQFRPVVVPAVEWIDISIVSYPETLIELLPPQQGAIEFRVRGTSTAGVHSGWVESGQVFITGGSATDAAVYGADGDFISTRHFSINSDDFVLSSASASGLTIINGAFNGTDNSIVGETGEELQIDWIITITDNMVNRRRHFYLNLGNITSTGTRDLDYWSIDNETVVVEVLTDPADSELMFLTGGGTPDTHQVYTDAPAANISNTRSFSARADGGFMYATRTFIRLPMRRTFTFREAGQVCLRLRFIAVTGGQVTIDTSAGNELTFEAYSTELIDDTELTGVSTAGTTWTFSESFEAPPKLVITPQADVRTWFTNKTNTSVNIHTSNASGVDVDVMARGY